MYFRCEKGPKSQSLQPQQCNTRTRKPQTRQDEVHSPVSISPRGSWNLRIATNIMAKFSRCLGPLQVRLRRLALNGFLETVFSFDAPRREKWWYFRKMTVSRAEQRGFTRWHADKEDGGDDSLGAVAQSPRWYRDKSHIWQVRAPPFTLALFFFLSFSLLFKAHHLSDGWKAREKNFKLS